MTTDRAGLEKVIAHYRKRLETAVPAEFRDGAKLLVDAAQAWADTLPKVRTTATWQVQYVIDGNPMVDTYRSYHEARRAAAELEGRGFKCVHLVGPVMHEVPT